MIEDAVIAERLYARKLVHWPAQIESEQTKCLGIMQDMSKSGGRLFMKRFFPVDTEIRVILAEGIERNCVVRRCVALPDMHKFDLGFEVLGEAWPDSILSAAEGSENETVHPY